MAKKKKESKKKQVFPVKIRYRCNVCGTVSDLKECCGNQDCAASYY